jgi:hypothetical protein
LKKIIGRIRITGRQLKSPFSRQKVQITAKVLAEAVPFLEINEIEYRKIDL